MDKSDNNIKKKCFLQNITIGILLIKCKVVVGNVESAKNIIPVSSLPYDDPTVLCAIFWSRWNMVISTGAVAKNYIGY